MKDKIQAIRDLTRPVVTFIVTTGFFLTCFKLVDDKPEMVLNAVSGILGTVLGYHFGKSAKRD